MAALMSMYPNGFSAGISIKGIPLIQTHPGRVFWVYNGTTLDQGHKNGSNGNKGTFDAPFSTLDYAVGQCRTNKGDIIFLKPGHAETISNSTAMAWDVAGIAIIGLGYGANRPTFTLDTATTATITVSVANVSVQNILFVANFLAIVACFTVTTAKDFCVENCEFRDTSSTLNFLVIVSPTGAANTSDGLTFNDNKVINLGVTSNNTTISFTNDVDRFTAQRNYLKWAVQNDKPILADIVTGVCTNIIVTDNFCYRPNTTTAGGSLIKVGGTTSTGVVVRNYVQTLTTATDLLFTTTVGLAAFENRVTGVVGATGFVIPAVDA